MGIYFKDIIGQEDVKQHLIQSVIENRISHAQLICGSEGVGALPLAIAYARYIACAQRGVDDACGKCPSCIKIDKLAHPDLHFVFPIVKSSKPKLEVCDDYISEWRDFVTQNSYFNINHWLLKMEAENKQALIYTKESDEILKKLNLKSYEALYKTMIIWLPEKMHEDCANKLLKLLEEPPENTLFLLVSETPEALLPTILSRSQRINIKGIACEAISTQLVQKFGVDPTTALSIARMANGNFIKAMETIHLTADNKLFFDYFISLMRLAYQRKVKEMKLWSEAVAGIGRERQKNFLQYAQRMIRENFIFNLQQPAINYLNQDEFNFASRFAPFVNERNVIQIMDELALAEYHVERNVNSKFIFFDLSLQMIVLLKK